MFLGCPPAADAADRPRAEAAARTRAGGCEVDAEMESPACFQPESSIASVTNLACLYILFPLFVWKGFFLQKERWRRRHSGRSQLDTATGAVRWGRAVPEGLREHAQDSTAHHPGLFQCRKITLLSREDEERTVQRQKCSFPSWHLVWEQVSAVKTRTCYHRSQLIPAWTSCLSSASG